MYLRNAINCSNVGHGCECAAVRVEPSWHLPAPGKGHTLAASSALWMWRTQMTVTFTAGGR